MVDREMEMKGRFFMKNGLFWGGSGILNDTVWANY